MASYHLPSNQEENIMPETCSYRQLINNLQLKNLKALIGNRLILSIALILSGYNVSMAGTIESTDELDQDEITVNDDEIPTVDDNPEQLTAAEPLVKVDFSDDTVGPYTKADFIKDWKVHPGVPVQKRMYIVYDDQNSNSKVLRVTYLAYRVGGVSGMAFTANIGSLKENKKTHLFFQYKVKFPQNFTWVKGGKLPGLTSYPYHPTGCIAVSRYDGFSTRMMWREAGQLFEYIYNPTKVEKCGDYYQPDQPFYFVQNKWYTLTQEVKLNTPEQKNGMVRQWVDGKLILEIDNILLRKKSNIHINQIKMDSFFGGKGNEWKPETDQYAYFADFLVTESMPPLN
jgi:hypothetical protein